jgi:hypothetical protein
MRCCVPSSDSSLMCFICVYIARGTHKQEKYEVKTGTIGERGKKKHSKRVACIFWCKFFTSITVCVRLPRGPGGGGVYHIYKRFIVRPSVRHSFVHKSQKSSGRAQPSLTARLVPLVALRFPKHDHIRRQTRKLTTPKINTKKPQTQNNAKHTHPGTEKDISALRDGHVHRLCVMLLLARKTQIAARAYMRVHASRPDLRASTCSASLSSASHSGLPVVSTYTCESGVPGNSAVRTSRTRATICAMSGKQCARCRVSFSGDALPVEATSDGEKKRSGRPVNSLKPIKRADQFTQWLT